MSHSGPKFGDVVIDCVACGFAHLYSIPSPRELDEFYAQYYSNIKPHYVAEHEQDRAWWDELYAERLALIEELVTFGPREDRLLLDYGAGPGYFCEAAGPKWLTFAFEPNSAAAKLCQERAAFTSTELEPLTQLQFPPFPFASRNSSQFPCITLFEVLEHVPNPLATLEWCAEHLTGGGVIAIQVPNDFNSLQLRAVQELGLPQYWIARPDHINYFTPQTLTSLLERAGFKIEYRCTSYPMESFLLAGLNYVEDAELGRRCHKARMEFDLALGRKERAELYQSLWDKGIGRDLFVIARKA